MTDITDVYADSKNRYTDALQQADTLLTELSDLASSINIEDNLGLGFTEISTDKQVIDLPTLPTATHETMGDLQNLLNEFSVDTVTGQEYASEFLTFLKDTVEYQISVESTGIRPADQEALFLRGAERSARVYNETAEQEITRTSRGFPLPTGMVTAALADHGRRREANELDRTRDNTALIAERASVNMRSMIAQGVDIERFLSDYNTVIYDFYRTKAGILVDQYRAERDDYFKTIGVDLENVGTELNVDKSDAESYYTQRRLQLDNALSVARQRIDNASARLTSRKTEAEMEIGAYKDAATYYGNLAASVMSQVSAISLNSTTVER